MNKQEFTEQLATRSDFSKAEAGRAVDAILDTVTESLAERDEVNLPGFGKFIAQRRRGREGSDPRNPDRKIRIPPAYVPKFRAGTALRRAVESSPGGEARDGQPSAGGRANRPPAQSSTESSRDEGRRSTRADSTPREAGQSRASGSGASQSDAAQSEAPQAPSPLPAPSRGTGGGWKPLSQR